VAGQQDETTVNLRTVRDVERSGFVNNFLVDQRRIRIHSSESEQQFFLAISFAHRISLADLWEANQPPTADQPVMLTRGLNSTPPTARSKPVQFQLWDVPPMNGWMRVATW
jgi:hypothetical protein